MRQTPWYSDKINGTRTRTVLLGQDLWYSEKNSSTRTRKAVLGEQ